MEVSTISCNFVNYLHLHFILTNIQRKAKELERTENDLKRMSTRANDAEKKYLELTASQQSKSYSKPSFQKETAINAPNDPKPIPKVST